MTRQTWLFVAAQDWMGSMAMVRSLGYPVTAVVVGPRPLADAVATGGADDVCWVDAAGLPAEAYALSIADWRSLADAAVLACSTDPAARVLLGAVASRRGARLIPGVIGLRTDGDAVMVDHLVAGGDAIETVLADGPVAVIYVGDDAEPTATTPCPVTATDANPVAMAVPGTTPVATATGLADAKSVVSVGRGLRGRDDVALVAQLATKLNAEMACTMPVAEDLGWLPKERYVGRSGQQIAPQLYLAVGISGAMQHLEGIRRVRIVAAINNDPKARIFQRANYGVVADLHEIVPALIAQLGT